MANLLIQHGHEAIDVRDAGLRGVVDEEIAEYARKNNLCLLTADMGFANIRNYPPLKYSGIVVLRLPAKSTSTIILSLLKSVLVHPGIIEKLKGKLAIVEHDRVRIRQR